MPIRGDSFEMLQESIEAARDHVMSAEEKEEQRRSFAYGNVALHNPAVTREVIDKAAEELKAIPSDLKPDYESAGVEREFVYNGYHVRRIIERVTRLELEAQNVRDLKKLVEAADYLQHCRRSQAEYPHFTHSVDANRKRVERASDHYDYLRGQVKL